MAYNQLDFQKIDSTGKKFALNEEYILSYIYWPGFSHNLLVFSVFIDIYYECRGHISFFHYDWRTKKTKTVESEIGFDTPLETPPEIKKLIDLLINQDQLEMKDYYSDIFLEDSSNASFVINHKGVSHNVRIETMLKELQNKTESERIIFLLEKEFKKLQEEIYNKMLLDE